MGGVLNGAENAAPGDAVDEVTWERAVALGALFVSFPIADPSGRALVSLRVTPFS